MNFFDLVHCQTTNGCSCLCVAPTWSNLKANDIVRVGDSEMKIIKISVAGISRETYDFMQSAGYEIKHILSKVVYDVMDYAEYETEYEPADSADSDEDLDKLFIHAEVSE